MAEKHITKDMANLTVEGLSEKVSPLVMKNVVQLEKAMQGLGINDPTGITAICIQLERHISPFAYLAKFRYSLTKSLGHLKRQVVTFYSASTASKLVTSGYRADGDMKNLMQIVYHLIVNCNEGYRLYRTGITRQQMIQRREVEGWLSTIQDLNSWPQKQLELTPHWKNSADEVFEGLLKQVLDSIQNELGIGRRYKI